MSSCTFFNYSRFLGAGDGYGNYDEFYAFYSPTIACDFYIFVYFFTSGFSLSS